MSESVFEIAALILQEINYYKSKGLLAAILFMMILNNSNFIMSKKIYVQNLPIDIKEEDLQILFEAYGTVTAVMLESDNETGKPKGAALVKMEKGWEAAIKGLNNKEFNGKYLRLEVLIGL